MKFDNVKRGVNAIDFILVGKSALWARSDVLGQYGARRRLRPLFEFSCDPLEKQIVCDGQQSGSKKKSNQPKGQRTTNEPKQAQQHRQVTVLVEQYGRRKLSMLLTRSRPQMAMKIAQPMEP